SREESPSRAGNTDVVVAPPGAPVGDLDVTVTVDAGVPIADPLSPSHRVAVTRLDERRCVVTLVEPRLPIKDLVIRYRIATPTGQIGTSCWSDRVDGGSGEREI